MKRGVATFTLDTGKCPRWLFDRMVSLGREMTRVLVAEYGAEPSYEDPARYSFAHGGKDTTPFRVDRQTYDQTIEIMQSVVVKSRIERIAKDKALRRLSVMKLKT